MATTHSPVPVLTRCQCGEFWCSIHGMHAHDCICPPIEEWATDPYSTPAAALGRLGGKAGRGEAKRRGDSAYYKALRAKVKRHPVKS